MDARHETQARNMRVMIDAVAEALLPLYDELLAVYHEANARPDYCANLEHNAFSGVQEARDYLRSAAHSIDMAIATSKEG